MSRALPWCTAGLAALVLLGTTTLSAQGQAQASVALALQRPAPEISQAPSEGYLPAVTQVYERRAFQPIWTEGTALTLAGRRLVTALARAPEHGLIRGDYLPPVIDSLMRGIDGEAQGRLEVVLSVAALRFVHDLGFGIVPPNASDRGGNFPVRPFVPDSIFAALAVAEDPGAMLLANEPASPAYAYLKRALADLRAQAGRGGWHASSPGATLRAGARGPRVAELRGLLAERGDLPVDQVEGDSFDLAVAAALLRFQRRHGLEPDTAYGRSTVREINVPLAARIQQVSLGLERLRWLPPIGGARSIAVNLADFRLYLLDSGTVTFETEAVIGKELHETPMFVDTMTYVVINPVWNVPASIVKDEILPALAKDSTYLTRNHMERVGGQIRQLPGPWNSLGRFKFMFPNPYDIYVHDTPEKALFGRASRAFSHGCIRIRYPARLAELLLGAQGWDPRRIAATVAIGEPTVVPLEAPIPVRITYVTAFEGSDGTLQFRQDVYGRDRELLAAIARTRSGAWEP